MAQLQKGTTYITGDQVTAANLNALVDSGILTPGAVTDQTAKTVPLAADTILLHSAADTALRKTTMTQLFATPQPLGATTPSSIAATTGTFSSTLGVTGVATLGNGAILGTPASGTVTNLTGTASININGTVGATTPSTVAATTLAATKGSSGTVLNLLSGNSANYVDISIGRTAQEWFFGLSAAANNYATGTVAGDLVLGASGAANLFFGINNSVVGKVTSTGLNSTAIGATTPSTGAFTTVSATGNTTLGGNAVSNTQITINASASAGGGIIGQAAGTNKWFVGTSSYQLGGSTTKLMLYANGDDIVFYPNGTSVATISSAGAAITGTLSTSGSAIFGNTSTPSTSVGGVQINNPFSVGPSIFSQATATGNRWIDFMGSSTTVASLNNNSGVFSIAASASGAEINVSGTQRGLFSSTGLAVTGVITGTSRFVSNGGAGGGNGIFDATFNGNTAQGLDVADSANASGAAFCQFRNSAASVIGSITRVTTTNAVVYNTTSDARLKENFRDFTDSGRLIDALKPRVFDWKGDTDGNGKDVIGFVAQEEHAADPIFAHIGAVSVGDDDPTTITHQWQRSDTALIPILVAELQSLRKRLAALESK